MTRIALLVLSEKYHSYSILVPFKVKIKISMMEFVGVHIYRMASSPFSPVLSTVPFISIMLF